MSTADTIIGFVTALATIAALAITYSQWRGHRGKVEESPVNPRIEKLREMPSIGRIVLQEDKFVLIPEDDGEANGPL